MKIKGIQLGAIIKKGIRLMKIKNMLKTGFKIGLEKNKEAYYYKKAMHSINFKKEKIIERKMNYRTIPDILYLIELAIEEQSDADNFDILEIKKLIQILKSVEYNKYYTKLINDMEEQINVGGRVIEIIRTIRDRLENLN